MRTWADPTGGCADGTDVRIVRGTSVQHTGSARNVMRYGIFVVAAVPVQPHDELRVLADGGRVVAADGDREVAPEDAEGARDDQQRSERGPARSDRRGTRAGTRRPGRSRPCAGACVTSTTRERSTVQPLTTRTMPPHAIVSGCTWNGRTRPQQRVIVDQRVGVDRAEERVASEAERRVDARPPCRR